MSEPILIPRENVNDESATLVAWSVADGQAVTQGQVVAQVETSKAVVDLVAPVDGVLVHAARVGADVPIGAEIARVLVAGEAATSSPPSPSAPATAATNGRANGESLAPSVRRLAAEVGVDPARVAGTGRGGRVTKADMISHLAADLPERPATTSTRFSAAARARMAELGIDPATFAGRGLVRVADLQPATPPTAPPTPPPVARSIGVSGVATRSEALPRSKRVEAKYLRSGLEATLPSVVTVACPTRGFREALGDRAPAVLVAEVARLLRKYPAFNAYHDDGRVNYYEDVHIGVAVDSGRGLKVPVIRHADAKGVAAVADELRELVVAYLDDALPVESLAGGTFTITDLSGHGVTAFHPLINQGQAAILGVGAESVPAGGQGAFNLILAFDHQLAEGRTAALFLNDLRDRLAAYEAAETRPGDGGGPRCGRCQAGIAELGASGHVLIPSLQADGSTRPLCSLCLQGWR